MNKVVEPKPYEVPEVITWSFSAYKDFANCPKKYYHTRVIGDFTSPGSAATLYGHKVHEILEKAIRDNTPIPKGFSKLQPIVDGIRGMTGVKLTEYRLAVTPELEACDFDGEDRWWRGIADLIIIHDTVATVFDYKTGASTRFADLDQLKLLAAALCIQWPEIEEVRGALLFTQLDTVVRMPKMARAQALAEWERWKRNLHPLRVAYEANVWNTRRSGLCKFCPVITCLHHPDHGTPPF